MAVINTIREKMGTFVVVLVGVAILAFVIADLLGPQSNLFSDVDRTVGEIAGEEVTLEEFQNKMDELEAQYALRSGGRNLTEQQRASIRNQAWDALVAQKSFRKQYDELGLKVTDEEVIDMVQGNNISEELRQSFVNPETGEFDRNMLIQYLQNIENMPPQQQAMWFAFESSLRPGRERIKYENLLLKSEYVTTAEARREHKEQNSVAEVQYLYVPFYAVSDSLVQVTDAELQNYLEKNKERYKTDETRSIKYVTFPIQPSPEDREAFTRELNAIKNDFAKAQNDSLFAVTQTEGGQAFGRYAPDQLPAELRSNVEDLQEGQVYGPYSSNGRFVLYKVSGIGTADAARAKASHILLSAPEASPETEKQEVRARAEALLKRLRAGEDFAELARELSDDTQSATRGGDLGWFSEGQMVEPFEQAVFERNEPGLINRVVETSYGYHIIKVTEAPEDTEYRVARIETELTPSQNTRDQAYRKAERFATEVEDRSEFESLVSRDTLNALSATNIQKNDRRINDLYEARNVVMWAFKDKTSVGDVSEVFELEDAYVVATIVGKTEEGEINLDDVRDEVTAQVKNEKKAELIKEKLTSSTGTLEERAQAYGADATVNSASEVRPGDFSLATVGYAPQAIGAAFGQAEGQTSQPVEVQNGVVMVKTIAKTEAPEVADYATYREQIAQRRTNRTAFQIAEAVKDAAEVKDKRYKFF